ncbi:MAG TPA: KGG domain-containing protein [Pseudomonas sp.]
MPNTTKKTGDDKHKDTGKGSSGNFADDPKKASEAGKKGGKASSGSSSKSK